MIIHKFKVYMAIMYFVSCPIKLILEASCKVEILAVFNLSMKVQEILSELQTQKKLLKVFS